MTLNPEDDRFDIIRVWVDDPHEIQVARFEPFPGSVGHFLVGIPAQGWGFEHDEERGVVLCNTWRHVYSAADVVRLTRAAAPQFPNRGYVSESVEVRRCG